MKKLLIYSVIILSSGCEGIFCTASIEPGIELTVKNSNNEFIGEYVTAVIFDDDYIDTLKIYSQNELGEVVSLRGADERPGVYSLIILSDLYETYTHTNIVVWRGECHVKTVNLNVILDNK